MSTLLAVACTAPPEADYADWQVPVDEGIVVREYPSLPRPEGWREEALVIEDLVIGGDPDDPAGMLYRPIAVAASPDGTIFVADTGTLDIKAFASDGTFLKTLGTQGQGPGEFNRLRHLTVAGERLIAYDSRNVRFSVWTLSGDHLADHKLSASSTLLDLHGLADGTLVWSTSERHGDDSFERVILRSTLEGEQLTRLSSWPTDPPRGIGVDDLALLLETLVGGLDDRYFRWAVANGIYVAPRLEYQVLSLAPDGETRWALRVATTPTPWPADREQSIVDTFLADYPSTGGTTLSPDDIDWPERLPAVYDLRADGHGRLFVFGVPEDMGVVPDVLRDGPSDPWPVDVFSPEGNYITSGTVSVRWRFAQGNHVYDIRRDEDGEPVVVRYRLTVNGQ